jgi:hypothetical protein
MSKLSLSLTLTITTSVPTHLATMNADEQHPHSIAFHHALTTMDAKAKDGERSGYSTRTSLVPTRA